MSAILSPSLPSSTGNGALDAYTQAGISQIGAGGVDFTQTPTYQTLMGLLGPGPNGTLNPGLMAQYNAGAGLIGQQGQQNVASAISGAQGRGLGGSSIAAQGVENANFNTTMADSSLLGSLYGVQGQNTQALAGDVMSGSNALTGDLLSLYDSAGTSAANMQMYSQALQEALQAAKAGASAQQNAGMFAGGGAALGGIAQGLGYALA